MPVVAEGALSRAKFNVVNALGEIHATKQAGASKYEIASKVEEQTGFYPLVHILDAALPKLEEEGKFSSEMIPPRENGKPVRIYHWARDLARK